MEKHFTEAHKERIKQAVEAAEGRTSGEIVPFVVPSCDTYEVAIWRGASYAALLALALGLGVLQFYGGWGLGWLYAGWGMSFLAVGAGAVGALLGAYVGGVKRWLVGADQMARAVHLRAMQAFVEEEVFKTRDRTGILLFVSLLEHRVEVVGDEGINSRVTSEAWVDVVEAVIAGIKGGQLAEGLIEAIDRCGHLLETKGVAIQPDDTNELPNRLRLGPDS